MPLRAVTLVFLAAIAGVSAASPAGADAGVQQAYERLQRAVETGGIEAGDCPEMAKAFGDWVARQREVETVRDRFLESRELGERIHAACREGIRKLEAATNEDEAALETLYRSQQWYDINGALAALRYWQAWLDLALARHATGTDTRVTDLAGAKRGFEASSLRILYPGLVYGSWLGLAYVARLEGDSEGMRHRLELLQQALQSDPDNPLLEIVNTELGLAAVRMDPGTPIAILPGEPLTPSSARLAEEKAFALLAQHRETGTGAIEAATYLHRFIDQGFLDDRLFTRMLGYLDELAGRDIGPLGLLVDAEYAYAYQQYETDVLKFRQFLASPAAAYPLDLAVFRYHFAVSLYRIGLARDALATVTALRARDDLPAGLRVPLDKLYFIVADAMYREHPSNARAETLRDAATHYIATAPADPDTASAHLALARVAEGDAERARHLAVAEEDPRLRDSVRATRLEAAVARFRDTVAAGNAAGASKAAAPALELLQALPSERRESLDMRVLSLQLRSMIDDPDGDYLQTLDALYADPALTGTQKRALVWSRWHFLDRAGGVDALASFVRDAPAAGVDPALDGELYAMLRELEAQGRDGDLARLSGLWLPRLGQQPQLQRLVWLLQIQALGNLGETARALDAVHGMLAVFPNSGDAWEQLARQSEKMGDTFAAERALAHIADAEPEGSPRWLEVSLRRLQLLAIEPDAARSCTLYRHILSYDHRLQDPQQEVLADFSKTHDCTGQGEG